MNGAVRQLKKDMENFEVIGDLTRVFQNTASVKIRNVRQLVLNSKLFFNDIWSMYQQMRSESDVQLKDAAIQDKTLILFIGSPAGLAGPNDQKILDMFKFDYKSNDFDVVVVGSHAAQLLKQNGIDYIQSFEAPDITQEFSIQPIIDIIRNYPKTIAYYESYVSLTQQQPTKLELLVREQQLTAEELEMIESGQTEIIASSTYIFEPSLEVVTLTMERTMIIITLTQLLLESGLSHLASRFTTMTLAHDRADKMRKKMFFEFLSARRSERDAASREIIVAAKAGGI